MIVVFGKDRPVRLAHAGFAAEAGEDAHTAQMITLSESDKP